MTVRATIIGVVVWATVAAGLRILGGVVTPWAVLLAVPIGVLTAGYVLSPRGAEPIWAPLPALESSATNHQASSLASRLSEASEFPDRYRTRLQPRLRRLAVVRLRRAGVPNLDDPRAAGVLGAPLYRLVTDPTVPLPDPATAATLFAKLEEP